MENEKRHPSWWMLWLLVPVLGILGLIEARVVLSVTGHRIVEAGIVLAVFGLVAAWLRANEGAMLREMSERGEQSVDRPPEPAVVLSPGSGIGSSSNGNGRRRTAWYWPESTALTAEPEEGKDE